MMVIFCTVGMLNRGVEKIVPATVEGIIGAIATMVRPSPTTTKTRIDSEQGLRR